MLNLDSLVGIWDKQPKGLPPEMLTQIWLVCALILGGPIENSLRKGTGNEQPRSEGWDESV